MPKGTGKGCTPPTDYEKLRNKNISEKNEFLKSLNLAPILQSHNTNGASPSHTSTKGSKTRKSASTSPQTEVMTGRPNLRPRLARNESLDFPSNQDEAVENMNEALHEESEALPKKRKGRGHTRKEKIWARENDEPLIKLAFNEYDQPIGKDAKEFPNVVGSLVRTKGFPLSHDDWRDIDPNMKQKLCDTLECVYEMDEKLKQYTMLTAAKKWRDFKSDLKRAKFDETKTNKELLAACDSRVDEKEWAWLINYWRSPEGQSRSAIGKANRAKLVTPHTAGSKSFARVGHEWSEEHGRTARRHELFVLNHTHKSGRALKEAEPNIRALQEAATKNPELREKDLKDGDLFSKVFGREPRGHIRSIGLGPTPSTLGIPGHRKYTPTKLQMALAGRSKAEEENAILRGTVEKMQGDVQELKQMFFAAFGRREATPSLDSPRERGSNPTPNAVVGDVDDNSDPEEVANIVDDNSGSDDECNHELSNENDDGYEIMHRKVAVRSAPTKSNESGKDVFLLSLFGPHNIPVARATIQSTNPKVQVGGIALGHDCYQVVVNSVMKNDAPLVRTYGNMKTMVDAIGRSIAWPHQKIMNDTKAAGPSCRNLFISGAR